MLPQTILVSLLYYLPDASAAALGAGRQLLRTGTASAGARLPKV